jgi:hypothetical protein
MSRMVGGTFGVAAVGALFTSLSHARFEELTSTLSLSPEKVTQLEDALGTGGAKGALASLEPQQAAQVGDAMRESFVHALSGGLQLSAIVAAAGAVLAFALIEPKMARKLADQQTAEAAVVHENATA